MWKDFIDITISSQAIYFENTNPSNMSTKTKFTHVSKSAYQ